MPVTTRSQAKALSEPQLHDAFMAAQVAHYGSSKLQPQLRPTAPIFRPTTPINPGIPQSVSPPSSISSQSSPSKRKAEAPIDAGRSPRSRIAVNSVHSTPTLQSKVAKTSDELVEQHIPDEPKDKRSSFKSYQGGAGVASGTGCSFAVSQITLQSNTSMDMDLDDLVSVSSGSVHGARNLNEFDNLNNFISLMYWSDPLDSAVLQAGEYRRQDVRNL